MTDLFSPEAMATYLVTVIATGLSLLIVYLIVSKLLYKPITAMLEKRKNLIATQLSEAERINAEAKENAKQAATNLSASQTEAAHIVAEANSRALLEAEQVLKTAQLQALENSNRAAAAIEQERKVMIHEVRAEVSSLSMAIATKLVGESLDNDATREKVDQWIDHQLLQDQEPAAEGAGNE